MTATTVTPEIVRGVFLRRIVRSLVFSFVFSAFIISAFDGMRSRWCLAAVWVLRRFMSSCVGDGRSIRVLMISLMALSIFNGEYRVKVSSCG